MIRYSCLLLVFVTLGVAGSIQVSKIFNFKLSMVSKFLLVFKFYAYKYKNISWSCGLTAPNVKSTGNNKKLMKVQEIPYSIEQRHLSWKYLKDGSVRIQHLLLVEKEGHRKILIGKNGDVIRLDMPLQHMSVSSITLLVVCLTRSTQTKVWCAFCAFPHPKFCSIVQDVGFSSLL